MNGAVTKQDCESGLPHERLNGAVTLVSASALFSMRQGACAQVAYHRDQHTDLRGTRVEHAYDSNRWMHANRG